VNRIRAVEDLFGNVFDLVGKESLTSDEMSRLRSLARDTPQEDEEKMLRYMQAPLNLTASELFLDHLDGHKWVTSYAVYSDGVWAWSNALEYHVRRYHFRVPKEFVDHMCSRNWIPPVREDLDWNDIEKRYFISSENEDHPFSSRT
jgi:hypothetical protein